MKATTDTSSCNKVGKPSRRDREGIQDEMHQLLAKLKELVPNMPRNKRLSKLEIIQNVIDYIVDLQIALETHPASRPTRTVKSPSRQPLGVLSSSSNPCAAHETIHPEKAPSYLSDLVIGPKRPVSC